MSDKNSTTLKDAFAGSMKPMIILKVGTMKAADIARLNANGLCVVEAKDPASVRFVDPIPVSAARTKIETAAIEFSRKVMAPGFWNQPGTRDEMTRTFVDLLVKGTRLDPKPSQEEVERNKYNDTRLDEVRRLAREDARKEHAAAKAAKAQAASKTNLDAAKTTP